MANALFWLERYGIDGLRVDAVASMLYLDYSRPAGGWIPNKYGGRENLEAVDFLRRFNDRGVRPHPQATTAAEESTAWPHGVAAGEHGRTRFRLQMEHGLDARHARLHRQGSDPPQHHHGQILFGLHYAFSENFILPLSHDEVVHGKRSLLGRMPGDDWQRFANLRAYYGFMFGHPGKKLMFMGGEIGQESEWNHDRSLDWHLLDLPLHAGIHGLIRDLNRLYRTLRRCMSWIASRGLRMAGDCTMPTAACSPGCARARAPSAASSSSTSRPVYRRLPHRRAVSGEWREVLNTDCRALRRQQCRERRRVRPLGGHVTRSSI